MCSRNIIVKRGIFFKGYVVHDDDAASEMNPLIRPNSPPQQNPINNQMDGFDHGNVLLGDGGAADQLRMHLENELNALREKRNSLWEASSSSSRRKPPPADCFQFYKKSHSGNWAKCRLCGKKISRAARQSNLALLGHLQRAHAEQLELEEQFELLEKTLKELGDGGGEGERNARKIFKNA